MSARLRLVDAPVAGAALSPAVECPLCGRATGKLTGGCRACPMGRGCTTLTCPSCGYRFVPEDRWRARLERWSGWARRRVDAWI